MQESLGISITDKLIRYAKVKKDNNNYKIDSYGLKFYSNLNEALKQILNETDSLNTPISSEIANEKYYYFNIFSMTNRNYAEKAIKTEFESYCTENHLNSNLFEGRYIYTKSLDNEDQSRIVYIFDSQTDIAEKSSYFDDGKLETLVPLATTLPNLINAEKNKNSMIINLEEQTTITTVVDQSIYNVETLEDGMKEVIEKINEKENSYAKSYEVCKNTTIYTMETDYTSTEENEYLKYIVPTLYKIAEQVQAIKAQYKKIDSIYITGMGAVINNIDLYFKEYFKDSKVEVLKPYFLENQANINIKDYIEVNSAIALALQGLGSGIKTLNFLARDWKTDLKTLLFSDVGSMKVNKKPKVKKPKKAFKIHFDTNMKGRFDRVETILLRNILTAVMILILYSVASIVVVNQINSKIAQANDVKTYIAQQVTSAKQNNSDIQTRTTDYRSYITKLQNSNSALGEKRGRKNQITTMLNKIVYTIPDKVQLLSIDNTEQTEGDSTKQHITIRAQSRTYEQLAYFKAKLKNAAILNNIVSTEGQSDGTNITITIEGDLITY